MMIDQQKQIQHLIAHHTTIDEAAKPLERARKALHSEMATAFERQDQQSEPLRPDL